MKKSWVLRGLVGGWIGSFLGNGLLGVLFSSPWIKAILYDPSIQSELFITLTPQRNMGISVAGLVLLGGLHGLFFSVFEQRIPGRSWIGKGICWGVSIWALYWLFQEWFIYVTLLREPLSLAIVELFILLLGSILEGLVIAWIASRLFMRHLASTP